MKRISLALTYVLLWSSVALAQTGSFSYQRPLGDVTDSWHRVELPDEIFGKVSPDLPDIRILGVTDEQDTVEAPYILQQASEQTTTQEVSFTIINTTHNARGYYYTLALRTDQSINRLHLDVAQANFDWKVTLEGSQDQQEWFTIVEDYRIVSVRNALTNYQFTTVTFPPARYRYFRLRIDSEKEPSLTAVKVLMQQTIAGSYRDYPIQTSQTQENKQAQQTVVDISLALPVPVSSLKIQVADTLDYYRPLTIQYLADSFSTPQGWKHRYETLTSGTLSSLEENAFTFGSTTLQKMRLLIDNNDNQPLRLDRLEVKGYVHTLTARFAQPATYFLVYGNRAARRPTYDLARFADRIPDKTTLLKVGNEQRLDTTPSVAAPLVNQAWLWVTLVVVIGLLGWFSLRMMRKAG